MDDELASLLIVDSPSDFAFYLKLLEEGGIRVALLEVVSVATVKEALELLEKRDFSVMILSLFPSSDHLKAFEDLFPFALKTPIIAVSEKADENLALEALEKGAEDYLSKDEMTARNLIRAINYSLARQKIRESLRRQSFTDELTGVYNRRGFITLAQRHLALAKRARSGFYLFLVDVDALKKINDRYGHIAGDAALVVTANSLKRTFRGSDVVGRIGGDEFAVLALNTSEEVGPLLEKALQMAFREEGALQGLAFPFSVSIGAAYFNPERPESIQNLFERADRELYESKREVERW